MADGATVVALPDGREIDITGATPDQLSQLRAKLGGTPAASPAPAPNTAAAAARVAQPTKFEQAEANQLHYELRNPFEGGLKGMVGRFAAYLGGEGRELINEAKAVPGAIKGTAEAMVPLAVAASPVAPLFPNQTKKAAEEMSAAGKGALSAGKEAATFLNPANAVQSGNKILDIASDPARMTSAVKTAAEMAAPESIFGLGEDVAAVRGALAPDLAERAASTLADAQASAQGTLQAGHDAYQKIIFDKTDAIRRADAANPAKLDMKPVADAWKDLKGAVKDSNVPMNYVQRVIDVTRRAAAKGPFNFETLQRLRTDIGNIAYAHDIPTYERKLLNGVYEAATDTLKKRAADLGLSKEFEAYNKEYSSLMELKDTTLNKLLTFDPKSTGFFRALSDTKDVRVQNMLNRFDEAAAGRIKPRINQILKETQPLQELLREKGSGFMGRIGAVMRQPLYGGAGAIAGSTAASSLGIPGGTWIGGMVGASKGAELGDKLRAARALGKISYPGGRAVIEAGAGGMIPEQLRAGPAIEASLGQGGHAGGGVASVEELNRAGTNYTVSKGGDVTYHGKAFAPEGVKGGGAHVTVMPDGSFRVNAGHLTDAMKAALTRALKKS